jgi:hypothetical protein
VAERGMGGTGEDEGGSRGEVEALHEPGLAAPPTNVRPSEPWVFVLG